ncbi:MAG TPA: AAA family ATPase, partial [Chitinophagaceae bacterium]|nr:AAA family ATPase [Chitinophagaceae bacterium]
MKKGLVFGKFLPLHKGHLALIEFALKHCDHLYIVVCFSEKEPIDPITRKQWLHNALETYSNVNIISFGYDEKTLPNTSISSRRVSEAWAKAFKRLLPDVDIIFTSEPYGEFVAEYMDVQHLSFNEQKNIFRVSARQIRDNPFKFWDFIPEHVRYWFIKKIAVVGTESTGKSVLSERLARYYNTIHVPEMAREIIETTDECTFEYLQKIAELHAKEINDKTPGADKILFVDTDITITKSYSLFLFQKELVVEPWIE